MTDLRRKILKDRGLTVAPSGKGKKRIHTKFVRLTKTEREHLKTPSMKLIELTQGKTVEELLLSDTESALAKKLGVSKSCISKWIKKLQLRDFIPSCEPCNQADIQCLLGECKILSDQAEKNGRWDLVERKAKMMKQEKAM